MTITRHKNVRNESIENGGGGIRTHDALAGIPDFKSGAFDHSATPPGEMNRSDFQAVEGGGGAQIARSFARTTGLSE